ncbi:pentatricopeptide repeat-containing protein At3g20730 [Silene latifolia]|uniref:pentatricopeptide repeat-containing protein At3g20730 n=1 Tax=Silene latifolia TaxID=37657 RepID=UPI003D7815F9
MGSLSRALQFVFRNPVPSDPSFYMNLIQMCIDAKASIEGRLIHKYLFFNGLDSNTTLNTKMIIFYGKIGDMGSARKVFDKMPERNIVSWTALLSGYSQNGFFKDSLMVFSELRCAGVKGNQFTYGSALRACTKLMCLRSGMQIQGCLQKSRFVGNVFVQSALVDMHSKCGDIEDASCVFQSMTERDLVCWNTMIGGYSAQGFVNDSFCMFQSMLSEGMTPDCFTFGSLLTACAQRIHLPRVSQLHCLILQHGYESNQLLSRLLIDAYTKCGSIKCAYNVFNCVTVKDVMLYTALIAGFAREGDHYIDAFHLFLQLYRSGRALDDYIFCTVLSTCANSSSLMLGRQVHGLAYKCVAMYDVAMGNVLIDMYAKCGEIEEANRAFDQMIEKNVISWSSIIDGYAKHGNGHKAMTLYNKMENEGLKPNDVTFLSLLFACSHAGLTQEGLKAFTIMIEKHNISPSEKHYSCMVDILARGGQLEEALSLMQKMKIQPSPSLLGAIAGASNLYGDISSAKIAAKKLSDLDAEDPANYVALASLYATSGSWDDSNSMHKLIGDKNLRKTPGYSLVPFHGKHTRLLQN